MTTPTTKIERSGPAIRAILTAASPAECARFEAEFTEALARAEAEFDLASAEAVLDRWWGIAAIRTNPLSEQEQVQLARARAGDFTGLWERDEAGNWAQLSAMPRYGLIWLEIARALRRFPVPLEHPRQQPRSGYDEATDQWTTIYGCAGLIILRPLAAMWNRMAVGEGPVTAIRNRMAVAVRLWQQGVA